MPIFQVTDDEYVTAVDADALVHKLRMTSWDRPVDDIAFRKRAAYWTEALEGPRIRTSNNTEFVTDMVAAGVYRIVAAH